jgi:hypothetical protein
MTKIDEKKKLLRRLKKKMAKVQRKKIKKVKFRLKSASRTVQNSKHLYIIGNGFDLWHNLPTSYHDFYVYSKDTLDAIGDYYELDLNQDNPWHDFENSLGEFMWEDFFNAHNEINISSDDFRPKEIYGLEDELAEKTDKHVSLIKEEFVEWINQIDIAQAKPKLVFPKGAKFINFNYTSTLQSSYEIDDTQVFHIHGRAETRDDLIFGHGESIDDSYEYDETGQISGSLFSDAEIAAKYPLTALKKPVTEVLSNNNDYFKQLTGIAEVIVIGHSLSKIDLSYFSLIADIANNAQWKVYCYSKEEHGKRLESLINCGVEKDKIQIYTYKDLSNKHNNSTLVV